jgi:hypothetical protein
MDDLWESHSFGRSAEYKIQMNIKAIKETAQLDSLGDLITEVNKSGFPSFVSRLLTDAKPFANYETFQAVAIGLILPIVISPGPSYDFLKKLVTWENFQKISPKYQLPCVMKLIRASALVKKASQLLNEQIVLKLWQTDNVLWQMPMLYLTVEAAEYWEIEPELTRDVRVDTLGFYYSAMNQLMARKFQVADRQMMRAWALSKGAKDVRTAILTGMSLTAFLAKVPHRVFKARVKRKYTSPGANFMGIWSLDRGGSAVNPKLYRPFTEELKTEHARRVIIDVARSVTSVKLFDLRLYTDEQDPTRVFQALKESGELDVVVKGDTVYLTRPKFGARLETVIAELASE